MITYKDAGVDIEFEDKVIKALTSKIKFKRNDFKPVLKYHYAGAVEFGDYYLVLTTDGVGSKMIVAEMANKFDTVAIDMIAMNVNDAICIGAEPIALVDYIACGRITEEIAEQIGEGLNRGAEEANINIIGGETATLPEMVNGIDLAGTVLAIVKKDKIITGEKVKEGDVIIGLRSSGIHSNGLTLARKVLFDIAKLQVFDKLSYGKTVAEELLTPTRIYVKPVLEMVNSLDIHGLAHITGGTYRKLRRLNSDVVYYINNLPEPQPIFKEIQRLGDIEIGEMFKTFNMGIGFCVITSEDNAKDVIKISKRYGIDAQIIGEVLKEFKINNKTINGKSVIEYKDNIIIL
ncbi:phosphoribosylaminoimidazole synthetase [Methanocaldococcus villosus KIN24-T80]|uniref:Phosphoribosylformylglycinamidine cyclo-ligase n=1 Tax=Methanocaldococcus villosus KIN24-T80 TaxID=1069083 RepID=N6VQ72_9EURY|nr:phosphoribosylformylglycinamidine cyclo-ligase [Methanocaldococcus villosus]ENN96030.1 phosphoribosylaminoimidazole synthetase [Methanocaldococcus villosus KIN24-T80]